MLRKSTIINVVLFMLLFACIPCASMAQFSEEFLIKNGNQNILDADGSKEYEPSTTTTNNSNSDDYTPSNKRQVSRRDTETKTSLKKLAIIIGVGDYQYLQPLDAPTNDADIMEEALKSCGFDVDKQTNLSQKGILRRLENWKQKAINYDIVVFYFSGHGWVDAQNIQHLLLVDTDSSKIKIAESPTLDKIAQELKQREETKVAVIIDACRVNGIPYINDNDEKVDAKGKTKTPIPVSRIKSLLNLKTFYACLTSENSQDGKDYSFYTDILVKHIRLYANKKTISPLLEGVRAEIIKQHRNQAQFPEPNGEFLEDFYLKDVNKCKVEKSCDACKGQGKIPQTFICKQCNGTGKGVCIGCGGQAIGSSYICMNCHGNPIRCPNSNCNKGKVTIFSDCSQCENTGKIELEMDCDKVESFKAKSEIQKPPSNRNELQNNRKQRSNAFDKGDLKLINNNYENMSVALYPLSSADLIIRRKVPNEGNDIIYDLPPGTYTIDYTLARNRTGLVITGLRTTQVIIRAGEVTEFVME